ncbi:hypothetical protein ABZ461_02240 [Actinacidiphila glaucinigra]|uniref:hypothetical protein n=1 Tax=Actinacidiphila glaucinigra TaxID=235986 RepID=UPI003407680F
MTGKHRKTSLWPHRSQVRTGGPARHAAPQGDEDPGRERVPEDLPRAHAPVVPGTHVDGTEAPHHRA